MPDANKHQALNALLGAECAAWGSAEAEPGVRGGGGVRFIASAAHAPGKAKILLDGRGVRVPGYPDGNRVGAPMIQIEAGTEAYADARASARAEIFGPVLRVLCVPTLDASSPRTRSGKALRCLRARGRWRGGLR
ncbi:hypothetical protein K438DRAFT_1836912 [Mycena galopus ATCC 62051]|nr:hypothetical protein K438DRAFT_1836912 [Mycena galopus ATCC 62051]